MKCAAGNEVASAPHNPGLDSGHGSVWVLAGEHSVCWLCFVRSCSRSFCVGPGRPLLRVRRRFRSLCRSPRAGWRGVALSLRCAGPGPSDALQVPYDAPRPCL